MIPLFSSILLFLVSHDEEEKALIQNSRQRTACTFDATPCTTNMKRTDYMHNTSLQMNASAAECSSKAVPLCPKCMLCPNLWRSKCMLHASSLGVADTAQLC